MLKLSAWYFDNRNFNFLYIRIDRISTCDVILRLRVHPLATASCAATRGTSLGAAACDGLAASRRGRSRRDARAIAAAARRPSQDVDVPRGAPFGRCRSVISVPRTRAPRLIALHPRELDFGKKTFSLAIISFISSLISFLSLLSPLDPFNKFYSPFAGLL